MLRNTFPLRSRFTALPKVIRLNKAYTHHDGAPHMGLMVFFFIGCVGVFLYWAKIAFRKSMDWDRASMPTRQERYERTVWAGGLSHPELVETTFETRSHKGPRSPEMLSRAKREAMATRREE